MSPSLIAELDQVRAMEREMPRSGAAHRARRQLLQRAHMLDSTDYFLTGVRGRRLRRLSRMLCDDQHASR